MGNQQVERIQNRYRQQGLNISEEQILAYLRQRQEMGGRGGGSDEEEEEEEEIIQNIGQRNRYRAQIDEYYTKRQRDICNELRRYRTLKRRRAFTNRNSYRFQRSEVTNQQEKVRGGEAGTLAQYLLPNKAQEVTNIGSEAYNTVFNGDGTKLLVTSRHGLTIINRVDSFMTVKHVTPEHISWAITDSDLSHDGRFLVHSSLHPYVSIYDIEAGAYKQRFNLASNAEEDESPNWYSTLRLFSVKFNQDASQLLASSAGHGHNRAMLKVFDINLQLLAKTIPAHDDDINTICYVDRKNSQIFISGSDDCRVKVWDMRALGIHDRPVGYLLGHVCGITSVASREDGYYVASNSKDQSLKLWDLRKVEDSPLGKAFKPLNIDYRYQIPSNKQLENIRNLKPEENYDNSVSSFYGQEVKRTLIRCHFSPAASTDRRYLYSASSCGKVFIHDILLNKTAAVLEYKQMEIVRDCIWHPYENKLLVADWNGCVVEWRNTPVQEKDFENLPQNNQQGRIGQMEDETEEEENQEDSEFYYEEEEEEEEESGETDLKSGQDEESGGDSSESK